MKPGVRTCLGALVLLIASLCAVGGVVERGRGRHIRRITAADLPATSTNSSSNTTSEGLPTDQPVQLIVTEVFNKSSLPRGTSELLGTGHPKQPEVTETGSSEKPSASSSKDISVPRREDLDDNNRANNAKEIRTSGDVLNDSQNNLKQINIIKQNVNGSENSPKDISSLEKVSSTNVPKELNAAEEVHGYGLSNTSAEVVLNEVLITSSSTYQGKRPNITDTTNSIETNKPKELIEDKSEESSNPQTSPKEMNITEVFQTSSSTYRMKRPRTSVVSPSNSSQELSTEIPTKSPKEININEVVSTRGSPRRLRKPILIIRKNGVLIANRTRALNETRTPSNCSVDASSCEQRPASNEESKAVVELPITHNSTALNNSTAEEVVSTNSKENSIETTTKAKSEESTSVRPTDGTFNNIDFSSTARMVLQEKIHEDILHHLTTVSYAHYETDYIMDDDADVFDAESQSSSKNISTVSYHNYGTGSESNNKLTPSFTTPRVDLFDETYARISEGIKQNLDEIEERSVEFESTSEGNDDHFGSSSDTGSAYAIEALPKNESRVSLEYVNQVDIIANNSAIANSKRGDLQVANGTHLGFERVFVQSKVMPVVNSTAKYLINDVRSTTHVIPTSKDTEGENNRVKGELGSASEAEKDEDQSLEGAEEASVTANPDKPEEVAAESYDKDKTTTETPGNSNRTSLKLKSQGRARMFPSERFHVNNTNNVEQRLSENTENKRLRSRITQESNSSSDDQAETTVSPRSRSYLLRSTTPSYSRTDPSPIISRRVSVTAPDTEETTSPRSNLIRVGRPSSRISSQENRTYTQGNKVVATRNDEGNDIPPHNTPKTTRSRGETKYAGVSASSISNEEFPIPPTAAAWSLVTMREPGSRTRLSVAGSKPKSTLQLVDNDDADSQTSGSYSKLTTIYNVIAPTTSMDMTEKSVVSKLETTTQRNYITRTESFMSTATDDQVTTEDSGVTTTEQPEVTTLTSSEVEESRTSSPIDITTTIPEDGKISGMEDGDNDELRFDVGTTVFPSLELTTKTAEQTDMKTKKAGDDAVPTTEGYETTRIPKEDAEKIMEDERYEDVDALVTTAEPLGILGVGFMEAGMSEDAPGGLAGSSHGESNHEVLGDAKEGEGHKTREDEEGNAGHQLLGEEKDTSHHLEEVHLVHGESDYGGPTGPDGGAEADALPGTTTTQATRSSIIDASTDDHKVMDGMTTPVAGNPMTSTSSNADTTTPGGVPVTSSIGDEPMTTVDSTDSSNTTVDETTDEPPVDATTTTTTTTTTTSTSTTTVVNTGSSQNTSSDDHNLQETKNVPSFLRLFIEASPQEFCETIGTFKKAVADLLTKGSGRIVNSDQVILRNFGRDQCTIPDHEANTTSSTGLLLPVELHLVDEAVNFDRQLNEAFPLLWGQEDMDFPLRILKVDVIATPDDFMESSVDNAGVVAAIAISCIGAACLLLLAILLIVMRKRQTKFNYGMRCTPVSLDAYSLDSVSIHDSVRRKAGLRTSKRSYGNPAFDDPSIPSHPLNFAGLAAFSTERGAMEDEFARIPHVTPKADELPPGSETKNRYANVLPLPETRVILSAQPHEQLGDYINANYVAGPKNAANFYIACQAPLPSTVTDFWRMVWEQQSKVIMMLTDFVENGVEKCADYLPPSEVLDCHRLFGDFQITLKRREVREKYIISTLQLKNLESNSWREVTHLWYISWPSQGVPEEPNSLIAFLIEARSYMKNRSGPSVVHCSPGTGRTGTVLACDLSIREFEHTRQVDIPRCVGRLRRDRAGCVQTRDQYAFIYQVLNLYATKLTGGALDSI